MKRYTHREMSPWEEGEIFSQSNNFKFLVNDQEDIDDDWMEADSLDRELPWGYHIVRAQI